MIFCNERNRQIFEDYEEDINFLWDRARLLVRIEPLRFLLRLTAS